MTALFALVSHRLKVMKSIAIGLLVDDIAAADFNLPKILLKLLQLDGN